MIHSYLGRTPHITPTAWVHPMATVIGSVTLAAEASIWPGASLRGDEEPVSVGLRSSIQDNCTLHNHGGYKPTVVGNQVTVGHNVVLHGCSIGNDCLIGMGSILLDGCEIGDDCFVAAGSLIAPRKVFPPGSFIMGHPARRVRDVTAADREAIVTGWERYAEQAKIYRAERI